MGGRPLDGVRVLELALGMAGPYAGKLLADLGADVVKAEPPTGDPTRRRGPFRDGQMDPEASGFFLYLNAGKRGVTLDLGTPDGRAALLDLVEQVDVVLESFAPGTLDRLDVGYDALRARNPRLVLVSTTPFGQWGPRAQWDGNDSIAFHSSGFAYGFPSREVESLDLPPLNAPSHASAFLAGEVAAAAAAHGLLIAQRDGHGGHLDVSMQEAVSAENQAQHNALEQRTGERGGYDGGGGLHREVTTVSSNSMVVFLPCSDGWVVISPREEHQWARWLEVMGSPAWAADPRFADRTLRQQHWLDLYPLMTSWSREHPKHEIFQAAQSRRVACYPLGTATDLLESPQLEHRGFFVEQEHPTLGRLLVPGVPYALADAERPRPQLAPRLGEHNAEVFGTRALPARATPSPLSPLSRTRERGSSALAASGYRVGSPGDGDRASWPADGNAVDVQAMIELPSPPAPLPHAGEGPGVREAPGVRAARARADAPPSRPLEGVRIVDFSWVMAGPICTKYLAALGAEVVKIESSTRPDLSHRNTSWEELNPSKRSITLNLKEERGRDLVRRLIAISDVVIENFSTGVMERLGLGYPTLREVNPRIIMASASGFGRTGPERDLVAYGSLLQCYTGWAGLSAYPGRVPTSVGGIWTDPLTACLEAFLLLAAIWRQRATGEGAYYDISMSETMIAALPEPILAWTLGGTVLEARGNRDPLVAPQGCYPAAGADRWIALTVRDDREWRALCTLMGRDDLAADSRLATTAGRRARHDEIDAAIAAWTRKRDGLATAEALQAVGIAATPTLTAADVIHDEHLAARSFVSEVERLNGGTRYTLGTPWSIDRIRPNCFRRAPRVGEDNEYIFKSVLGLDTAEYDHLIAEQVIY
ncbi:MAG: CoA transferase [Chloroflexi bacterium]|nr:CoA transferase [Chloroflexota bacterium]